MMKYTWEFCMWNVLNSRGMYETINGNNWIQLENCPMNWNNKRNTLKEIEEIFLDEIDRENIQKSMNHSFFDKTFNV